MQFQGFLITGVLTLVLKIQLKKILSWSEVLETHSKTMGKSKKPKQRSRLLNGYKSPHSDSAEYKMWGNGVALPCVVFVLLGIAQFMNKETQI